ncbi:Hypothetical protein R9X50_00476200 [Acrodontium crateriforme]|uniref:Zn(2)-C6 fungal-type domain-containing protein n=1 Tax=Acrodontium crateriforme TaxID=150365 RepID=A0AAQ3M655_9PEZI|nr:Hypothetical protein R9X50_00476200 [Acrodontium crateriforme]
MPPRHLRPKDEGVDGSDTGSDAKGKRKAISSACIPCRKRKSKCDGGVPSCSTCMAVYRTDCFYDADSDHRRKGALKRDIKTLQQQNNALDVIVASLRKLPKEESIALLDDLRNDIDYDVLASSLRGNVRLPQSYAPQTLEADLAQQMAEATPTSTTFENMPYASIQKPNDPPTLQTQLLSPQATLGESPVTWFRSPKDPEFIDHLLNLYFTWIHPFHTFFPREHFLHDMGRGRTDFCSPLLVNAVMSFACHYSDRALALTDPHDSNTAGDAFFAEAKRLVDNAEKSCLTTIQALAIMSLRECSAGRDSRGYRFAGRAVRMALELGLHLSVMGTNLRSPEAEVRKITFWGIFNLETLYSVSFGRLSQLPRTAADIQKPSPQERGEHSTWKPYEDTNVILTSGSEQAAQPTLFIETYSKLSEIASDMTTSFYAPQERFTSRRLAATYAQYQDWYRELPDTFLLENTSLPHVLVLHMYYYACVLHLFRPYIKLDLRSSNLFPRETCTLCANEISALMNALRAMYGLRRISLGVTSLLLSASTIHLLNLPSEQATAHLAQGFQDFQAMAVNHQFAGRCVDIIRSLAIKWQITLPDGAGAPNMALRSPDQKLGTATSPSSAFFAATIPRGDSGDGGTQSRSSTNSSANHHESPLAPPQQLTLPLDPAQSQEFWTPFPAQGMPTPNYEHRSMMFGGPDDKGPQWMMGMEQGRHHSAPGGLDQNMSGMGQWSWQ